jgi:hypothetical protein
MTPINYTNNLGEYESQVQRLSAGIENLAIGKDGLREYQAIQDELKKLDEVTNNITDKLVGISPFIDLEFRAVLENQARNAVVKFGKLNKKLESFYPICRKTDKIKAYFQEKNSCPGELQGLKTLESLATRCIKQLNIPCIATTQIELLYHLRQAIANFQMTIVQKFKDESVTLIHQLFDIPEGHEQYKALSDKLNLMLTQTLPDSGKIGKRLYTELSVDVISRTTPQLSKDEKAIQFNLNLANPSKDFLKYVLGKIPLLSEDFYVAIMDSPSSPVMKKSKEKVDEIKEAPIRSQERPFVNSKRVSFAELPRSKEKTNLSQFSTEQLREFQAALYFLISTSNSPAEQIKQFRIAISQFPKEVQNPIEIALSELELDESGKKFGIFLSEVLESIDNLLQSRNRNVERT